MAIGIVSGGVNDVVSRYLPAVALTATAVVVTGAVVVVAGGGGGRRGWRERRGEQVLTCGCIDGRQCSCWGGGDRRGLRRKLNFENFGGVICHHNTPKFSEVPTT